MGSAVRSLTAPVGGRLTASRSRHEIRVASRYRLDLTVSVLRRLSSNVVDVLTPDGQYARVLGERDSAVTIRVAQVAPEILTVTIDGDERKHREALALARRVLGVERDLTHFDRAAARIPWLKGLAARMRGVRPPRYPTLWESCVNAIVFQQISLRAASAILRRLVIALGPPLQSGSAHLYAFPTATRLMGVEDSVLRAAGLSRSKLATLRRVGEALATGTLGEEMLEGRSSPAAATLLRGIKGIGPWTAAVILLRGLGRLDVFPGQDTSVARNLVLVAGAAPTDVSRVLRALSPQQGMLYYHLLLARLEARDDLGRPTSALPAPTSHSADLTSSAGRRHGSSCVCQDF
jgi:DNA-3-methyladenine glycosylase II